MSCRVRIGNNKERKRQRKRKTSIKTSNTLLRCYQNVLPKELPPITWIVNHQFAFTCIFFSNARTNNFVAYISYVYHIPNEPNSPQFQNCPFHLLGWSLNNQRIKLDQKENTCTSMN